MISNKKIVCIVLLVIIAIIFIYMNQEYFFPVKESALFGKVESAPQEDERAAYNDNKATTGDITTMTNDRNLENVDAQISNCQKLIDEIKRLYTNRDDGNDCNNWHPRGCNNTNSSSQNHESKN